MVPVTVGDTVVLHCCPVVCSAGRRFTFVDYSAHGISVETGFGQAVLGQVQIWAAPACSGDFTPCSGVSSSQPAYRQLPALPLAFSVLLPVQRTAPSA